MRNMFIGLGMERVSLTIPIWWPHRYFVFSLPIVENRKLFFERSLVEIPGTRAQFVFVVILCERVLQKLNCTCNANTISNGAHLLKDKHLVTKQLLLFVAYWTGKLFPQDLGLKCLVQECKLFLLLFFAKTYYRTNSTSNKPIMRNILINLCISCVYSFADRNFLFLLYWTEKLVAKGLLNSQLYAELVWTYVKVLCLFRRSSCSITFV